MFGQSTLDGPKVCWTSRRQQFKWLELPTVLLSAGEMPFGLKPQCHKCGTEHCEIWHRNSEGQPVCNKCHQPPVSSEKVAEKPSQVSANNNLSESVVEIADAEMDATAADTEASKRDDLDGVKLGPGTRSGNNRSGKVLRKPNRGRNRKLNSSKVAFSKGRGRRAVFKKQPMKAPSSVSTMVTSSHVFYQGMYYQVGDIVSVMDEEHGIYYAQIRGLLQDQYCEKSAVLTWLIPTQNSPPPEKEFDPHTYILGPEEELPRKLEYLEFVMHSPSEYFKLDVNARTVDEKEGGFIWTSMGPVRRTIYM